jgi:hypothetical protein
MLLLLRQLPIRLFKTTAVDEFEDCVDRCINAVHTATTAAAAHANECMFPNHSLRPGDDIVDHTVISLSDGGEVKPLSGPIYDAVDASGGDPSENKLPLLSPEELLGLTFLRDGDDGQKFRAKVVKQPSNG